MSNRYALVEEDGLVGNVIEWDGVAPWSPPDGVTALEAPAQVSVGWRLAGDVWSPPEEA